MKEGTAPLNKNFEAWNITGQGITISFGDYQIGPYAMGKAQVTIPFRDLENLLKSNWLSQQKLPQVADSQ
jgi:uncharacterized protein YlxW (UPF0749 family)